jgi:threonine dehydrogenase-like Zn-dependent dehydrogenase
MLKTVLSEPYNISISDVPVLEPLKGEVLIHLTMIGICGSDVHLFKKGHQLKEPLTIGHEGIGIIEKVGEGVSADRVGQRVVIEPNIPCYNCPECWSGKSYICRNKRIIGVNETGCFAEYINLPGDFAHVLPDMISDIDAVAIEPATVALAALNRSTAKPGDTIAIIGQGAIGMLLTHIAISLGYKVIIAELIESKIKKSVDMGAIFVKGANTKEETATRYQSVFQKEEVKVLFECAGSEDSAEIAIASAPRGVDIMLVGLSEKPVEINPRLVCRQGNNIYTSLIYDHPFDFKRCIRLIENNIIKPGMIVSSYFPLEQLGKALAEVQRGEETKAVIRIR